MKIKAAFPYIVFVLLCFYASSASLISLSKRSREKSVRELALVADTDDYIRRSRIAEDRSREISKQGVSAYTYRQALDERQTLTRRIEHLVTELGGVMEADRDYADITRSTSDMASKAPLTAYRARQTISGQPLVVLNILQKIETTISDVHIRSSVWTGQNDGTVMVSLVLDVWPIPRPDSTPAKTR